MSNLKDKLGNRMLQNQLDDFLDDYGIGEHNLCVAFEHFCNYCMFSLNAPEVYHSDGLFHDAVHTGKSGDCAIDGIMILINDVLCFLVISIFLYRATGTVLLAHS